MTWSRSTPVGAATVPASRRRHAARVSHAGHSRRLPGAGQRERRRAHLRPAWAPAERAADAAHRRCRRARRRGDHAPRCWRASWPRPRVPRAPNWWLGCTFTAIEQDAERVEVSFTDGQRQRYDLVIGADGLYSKVREAAFPAAAKPRYSGQAVWRASAAAAAGDRDHDDLDGPAGQARRESGVRHRDLPLRHRAAAEQRPRRPRDLRRPPARSARRLCGAHAACAARADRPRFADRVPSARGPADAAALVAGASC